MSPAVTATAVDRWLYGRLAANTELGAHVGTRIRSETSQPGEAYPLVIYSALSPGVDQLARTVRVTTELVYLVKAVGKVASYVALEPIVAAIEAALDQQQGQTPDGLVVNCWREGTVRYPEEDETGSYRHFGTRFRLRVYGV